MQEGLMQAGARGGGALVGGLIGSALGPLGTLAGSYIGEEIGGDIYGALSTSEARNMLEAATPSTTFGRGFDKTQRTQIAQHMRGIGLGTDFSVREVNKFVAQGMQAGLFTGIQDVDSFEQQATKLMGAIRNVSKGLRVSAEEAMETIGSMRGLGVTDIGTAQGIITQTAGRARMFGQDPAALMQQQMAMGQAAVQMGFRAEAGMVGVGELQSGIMGAMQRGAMSAQQLADIGGVEGGAQGITAGGLQFLRNPFMRAMAASGQVGGFMSGNINPMQAMNQASMTLGGRGGAGAMLNFLVNERDIMSDVGAMGGNVGAARLAGQVATRAIEGGMFSERDRANLETYFISNVTGQSMDKAAVTRNMASEKGLQAMAESRIRERDTMVQLHSEEQRGFWAKTQRKWNYALGMVGIETTQTEGPGGGTIFGGASSAVQMSGMEMLRQRAGDLVDEQGESVMSAEQIDDSMSQRQMNMVRGLLQYEQFEDEYGRNWRGRRDVSTKRGEALAAGDLGEMTTMISRQFGGQTSKIYALKKQLNQEGLTGEQRSNIIGQINSARQELRGQINSFVKGAEPKSDVGRDLQKNLKAMGVRKAEAMLEGQARNMSMMNKYEAARDYAGRGGDLAKELIGDIDIQASEVEGLTSLEQKQLMASELLKSAEGTTITEENVGAVRKAVRTMRLNVEKNTAYGRAMNIEALGSLERGISGEGAVGTDLKDVIKAMGVSMKKDESSLKQQSDMTAAMQGMVNAVTALQKVITGQAVPQ
jgi:hypothetical protein